MERMAAFLMMLLGTVPVLLAALIGGVVAMVLWRRASRSALLVLLACVGLFVLTLFGAWLMGWWLPAVRAAGTGPLARFAQLMGIWGVCGSLLHGAMIGLLIWAAFAGRPRTRAVSPPMT